MKETNTTKIDEKCFAQSRARIWQNGTRTCPLHNGAESVKGWK